GLKEFEASITLCPDNAWVYYKRACAYDLKGERQKAICDYTLALAKDDPRLPLNKIQHAEARLHALVDGQGSA
ncbi:MAG: tetratricopeptide repeat protein, partial [Rhabdochlamydiaceae bacterium]